MSGDAIDITAVLVKDKKRDETIWHALAPGYVAWVVPKCNDCATEMMLITEHDGESSTVKAFWLQSDSHAVDALADCTPGMACTFHWKCCTRVGALPMGPQLEVAKIAKTYEADCAEGKVVQVAALWGRTDRILDFPIASLCEEGVEVLDDRTVAEAGVATRAFVGFEYVRLVRNKTPTDDYSRAEQDAAEAESYDMLDDAYPYMKKAVLTVDASEIVAGTDVVVAFKKCATRNFKNKGVTLTVTRWAEDMYNEAKSVKYLGYTKDEHAVDWLPYSTICFYLEHIESVLDPRKATKEDSSADEDGDEESVVGSEDEAVYDDPVSEADADSDYDPADDAPSQPSKRTLNDSSEESESGDDSPVGGGERAGRRRRRGGGVRREV